jgi:hypothetical protein
MLWRHFRDLHPLDKVVVSTEGYFPGCEWCAMQVNPAYPRHIRTQECQTGVERKLQRESAVRSALALRRQFSIHGDVLEPVEVFKYLGHLLTQDDNNAQAIRQQLQKAQGVWARVGQGASVTRGKHCPKDCCQILQSSSPSRLVIRKQDVESHQLSPGKARGVPRMCSIQDGKEASAKEGCQLSLGLSNNGGRTERMRHGHHCRVYPVPPPDDHSIRGNETSLQGLYGGRTAARVNATSVVVGATNVLGRI